MQSYLFQQANVSAPQKSRFDKSYRSLLTMKMDYLVPIFVENVMPGQIINLNSQVFARTAPLVSPAYVDMDVKLYSFFVPHRIIWKDWRKFISQGDGRYGVSDSSFVAPRMPYITNVDLCHHGNISYTDRIDRAGFGKNIRGNRIIAFGSSSNSGGGQSKISDSLYHICLENTGEDEGSLSDYLGIPSTHLGANIGFWSYLNFALYGHNVSKAQTNWNRNCSGTLNVESSVNDGDCIVRTYNSLPFRAYNKIWYDWFRDVNYDVFDDAQTTEFTCKAYSEFDISRCTYSSDERHNNPFGLNSSVLKLSDHTNEYEVVFDNFDEFVHDDISGILSNISLQIWNPEQSYYNSSSFMGSHDSALNLGLLRKHATKDYFNSSLPSPQFGNAVTLPLGTDAPVEFNFDESAYSESVTGSSLPNSFHPLKASIDANGNLTLQVRNAAQVSSVPFSLDNSKNLKVNLSAANSATIESLRVAYKMQSFLEKLALTGTKYADFILTQFGSKVPDSVTDTCSLISTGRVPVQISSNTSDAPHEVGSDIIPAGTQTGTAIVNGGIRANFSATEHGTFIVLACIEPRTVYGSHIQRFWDYRQWLDYSFPHFANLGEQEIWKKEIMPTCTFYRDASNLPDKSTYDITLSRGDIAGYETFGYQSRYTHEKVRLDEVHGDFKDSLHFWTLQKYRNSIYSPISGINPYDISYELLNTNCPYLKSRYASHSNTPSSSSNVSDHASVRSFNVLCMDSDFMRLDYENIQTIFNSLDENVDKFYLDVRHNFTSIAPLPLFSNPNF